MIKNNNSQLQDLRNSIDLLDDAIINILAERMRVVLKVGQYKKLNNILALDKDRWQKVLSSKLESAKQLGLNQDLIEDIYNLIHEHALKMETK